MTSKNQNFKPFGRGKHSNHPNTVVHTSIQFDKLFCESTTGPTAAKSAGTVGKWGVTSFTSIRSSTFSVGRKESRFSSLGKKKLQEPDDAVQAKRSALSIRSKPENQPRKFFKSRNSESVASDKKRTNGVNVKKTYRNTRKDVVNEIPASTVTNTFEHEKNWHQKLQEEKTKIEESEKPIKLSISKKSYSSTVSEPVIVSNNNNNNNSLNNNCNNIVNYNNNNNNNSAITTSITTATTTIITNSNNNNNSNNEELKRDENNIVTQTSPRERDKPPIVLRIFKGTSRLITEPGPKSASPKNEDHSRSPAFNAIPSVNTDVPSTVTKNQSIPIDETDRLFGNDKDDKTSTDESLNKNSPNIDDDSRSVDIQSSSVITARSLRRRLAPSETVPSETVSQATPPKRVLRNTRSSIPTGKIVITNLHSDNPTVYTLSVSNSSSNSHIKKDSSKENNKSSIINNNNNNNTNDNNINHKQAHRSHKIKINLKNNVVKTEISNDENIEQMKSRLKSNDNSKKRHTKSTKNLAQDSGSIALKKVEDLLASTTSTSTSSIDVDSQASKSDLANKFDKPSDTAELLRVLEDDTDDIINEKLPCFVKKHDTIALPPPSITLNNCRNIDNNTSINNNDNSHDKAIIPEIVSNGRKKISPPEVPKLKLTLKKNSNNYVCKDLSTNIFEVPPEIAIKLENKSESVVTAAVEQRNSNNDDDNGTTTTTTSSTTISNEDETVEIVKSNDENRTPLSLSLDDEQSSSVPIIIETALPSSSEVTSPLGLLEDKSEKTDEKQEEIGCATAANFVDTDSGIYDAGGNSCPYSSQDAGDILKEDDDFMYENDSAVVGDILPTITSDSISDVISDVTNVTTTVTILTTTTSNNTIIDNFTSTVTTTVNESVVVSTATCSYPILKKGSIFKSRNASGGGNKNRMALYKYKWMDDKDNSTINADGNEVPSDKTESVAGSVFDGTDEFDENAQLVKVTKQITDKFGYEDVVTSVRCPRKNKEFYTVIKNVKNAHQIQESGEFQEFNDDVEYILDALQDNNPIGTRCLSAITLATKCMEPAFRMHVRAHGTVTKFFKSLHDATKDQSLGMCTATVMFVLSQDRLNMDLDHNSLELMLNLLESDASHKNALDDCGLTDSQLIKTRDRVRQICADVQAQGHAKHLNLDNITIGHLAMETLLSLTSKRAGEWFKEELRDLGGLEHIIKTIVECCRHVDDTANAWSSSSLDKIKKVVRCLRVLENVTTSNEQNNIYMLEFQDGILIDTLIRMYKVCDYEIPLYPTYTIADKECTGAILRECLIANLKVLINITQTYSEKSFGSYYIGSKQGVIDASLHVLLQLPQHIPNEEKFDLILLTMILLINLVEHCENNRKLIIDAKAPSDDESIFETKSREPAVKALISMFYRYEESAKNEEKKTDAILDGETCEKPAPQKSHEELVEETVAILLHKAGQHMEHTMIAAHVGVLIGHIISENEEYEIFVRKYLPELNFATMISVLQKFFSFVTLTASGGVTTARGIKSMQKVIQKLIESDQKHRELTVTSSLSSSSSSTTDVGSQQPGGSSGLSGENENLLNDYHRSVIITSTTGSVLPTSKTTSVIVSNVAQC